MSVLGKYQDEPHKIIYEGREITLHFSRTGQTTGQISWSLPKGAPGCSPSDLDYNGIVIIGDTTAIKIPTGAPTDTVKYVGDATLDVDLHVGDTIGTGLVVAALYDDKIKNTVNVTGLSPTKSYYFAGYAVDNTLHYHTEGVYSYSLAYKLPAIDGTAAYHTWDYGIIRSDLTGLSPGGAYTFTIEINDRPPLNVTVNGDTPHKSVTQITQSSGTATVHLVNHKYDTGDMIIIEGANQSQYNISAAIVVVDVDHFIYPVDSLAVSPATGTILAHRIQTYQDLLDKLNLVFSTLDSPFQDISPPNTGGVYYNGTTQILYIWNGTENVPQSAILYPVNPTGVTADYWINPTTDQLHKRSGASWNNVTHIDLSNDPVNPVCDQYWYDQSNVYKYDGTTWILVNSFSSAINPVLPPVLPCKTIWFNTITGKFQYWQSITGTCISSDLVAEGIWVQIDVFDWATNPSIVAANDYWFDLSSGILNKRNVGNTAWVTQSNVSITTTMPSSPLAGAYWYNAITKVLKQWNGTTLMWDTLIVKAWIVDPAIPNSGDYWWNGITLYEWDIINLQYVVVNNFHATTIDPSLAIPITIGDVWIDIATTPTTYLKWDGMQWVAIEMIVSLIDPITLPVDTLWHNIITQKFYVLELSGWVQLTANGSVGHRLISYTSDPLSPSSGQFWINTTTGTVFQWNGISWVSISPVSTTSLAPTVGTLWYDINTNQLMIWTGSAWIVNDPDVIVAIDSTGNICFHGTLIGCSSKVIVTDAPNTHTPAGFIGLFVSTIPVGTYTFPILGSSADDGTPHPELLGVGTDGNPAHRREMVENILVQLGYPTIQVELTKEQLEFCVDQGLQYLRRRTSVAYDRVFFFLQLQPDIQHYILTNECVGFNKVVDITAITRMSSAFLGQTEGQGVYGQIVLQHLYSMGTFDLVSYHIMSEYIELMEILFASRIAFTWNETHRRLSIHQRTFTYEKVLVDAVVERTEQALLQDRWTSNWIQTWATAEARQILAEIRGKFSTLPGAGGGVTLNSQALRDKAKEEFEECIKEVEDYVVDRPELFGIGTQFTIG